MSDHNKNQPSGAKETKESKQELIQEGFRPSNITPKPVFDKVETKPEAKPATTTPANTTPATEKPAATKEK